MSSPVYFLLHVPKCAGTTVEQHFEAHLGSRFTLAPRRRGMGRNFHGPHSTLDGLDDARIDQLTALSGHSLSQSLSQNFPGRQVREAVLLRDPLSYFLSFYNYRIARHTERGQAEPPPFATWYQSMRKNPMSRFIMNRYFEVGYPRLYRYSSADRLAFLEERLTHFYFVGSYRHCNEMVAGISREIGIDDTVAERNVAATYHISTADIDKATQELIQTENALDQALFDRWKDRKWSGYSASVTPHLPAHDRTRYLTTDISSAIHRRWRG